MKFEKTDWINILISLVIALFIFYLFTYLNEPITSWFILVIFFLVLIDLKLANIQKNMQKKK